MKITHKHWFALTASTLGLTGLSLASSFGDEKYTYDASGNVLEKQIGDQVTRYEYTGNQLKGSTSDSTRTQYAYDSSGRLTIGSEAGKPTRNMEHQYLDKVTKVQNGDKTTEFFYNAEGQLVATNSAGTSETFAWDGLAMVNRGEQLYVNEDHAAGGGPVIVENEVAVSDMIGTSLSVGDGSFVSTAFGEGLVSGLFTGKPYIEGLEGFIFNYRTYRADDLRWTSPDPTGFPDGKNNLAYGGSNPVTNIDPTGSNFLHFDNNTLTEYDGDGYLHGPEGKIDWGNSVQTWPAISNNKSYKLWGGGTPHGWYNVGNQLDNNNVFQDSVNSPNTNQGSMSLWSRYGSDYGTDVGSGTGRTGRYCSTAIYNGGTVAKATWAFNMGASYIPLRLKAEGGSDYWQFPSGRTASSIQMHPDGNAWGTAGCIGFVGYSKAEEFRYFANSDGSFMEVFVEY
jgi:RHS repeat-associated protein